MKGTKDLKTNKGITLIALVITIIVMLILVAVTITMAVNGGLFEYASNAGTKTNAARDAEQEFANLDADMTVDQLIEKYTGWTEEGKEDETIPCGKCTDGWITGYTCGEYGNGCNVINSTYNISAYQGSCSCGFEKTSEENENISSCPSCGSSKNYTTMLVATFDKCSHEKIGLHFEEKAIMPCPTCTISFSFADETYYAIKGMTWEKWCEWRENSFDISNNFVSCSLIGFVHYEDGTRVKSTEEIRSRLYIFKRIEF